MADALTTINYQDTLDKAAAIEKSANAINSVLDRNSSEMKAVDTDDVWQSDAAAETRVKYEQLAKNFQGAYNAMEACVKHLREVVEIHKEVDRVMKQKADELLSTNV